MNIETNIESTFIKANTLKQFINIQVPSYITQHIHKMNVIKIKMEADTDPPGDFSTEIKNLLLPFPFSVLTLTKEDLFAGKISAVLCRAWKNRVKGRDWYDLYWYISRNIPVNLTHLETRLAQSPLQWDKSQKLTHDVLVQMLNEKLNTIDFESAKSDINEFIKDATVLSLWSKEFFANLIENIKIVRN